MKFQIPLDKSITFDVIKEFCNLYYPEMPTDSGFSIVGSYKLLQKNPWVCALFFIKHKEKKGVTNILIRRDGNVWARLIGGPFVNHLTRGNFYTEVESKFVQFLHDRGIEQVVQTNEGLNSPWMKKYGYNILAFIMTNILALFLAVGIGFLIDESLRNHPKCYTSDYEVIEPSSNYDYDDYDYDDDDYGETDVDDSSDMYQLKHLPTGKIVYQDEYSIYFEEVSGHALMMESIDDDMRENILLFDEDGNKKVLYKKADYADFLDDEIIYIRANNYRDKIYVDFDGNPVSNFKTFWDKNMAIIEIILMILIVVIANVVCWLIIRKIKKGKANKESSFEITGTAVADDGESTIV